MNWYIEEGRPSIINEKTIEAARLISAIYLYHGLGGYAHGVIEHWQLEDTAINCCLQRACENKYHHCPEQVIAAMAALKALKALSVEERYSALALHYGYLQV
ncbi:MAG: hypothetical protein M3342_02845 [Bacteroidota bacterium]|nr:hypothetical protein [Bacteroidota bacterium]